MLVGYNTNVPFKGAVYHVQTEDSGLKNPMVITLLYLRGMILASKKTNYSHIAYSHDYKEKVRELMKEQHKNMIKELIAGKHTSVGEAQAETENKDITPDQAGGNPEQPSDPKSQIAKSLDDILLDYITRKNT